MALPIALLVLALPAAAQAQAPPLRAKLAACTSGPTAAVRTATFVGSMPAVAGTKRMWMRFDLLARMPNLLVVSTSGAGYDTVDVKDCTEAGVLVVNQTGGNAEAVAAHVVAMMLMLSKQIIQSRLAARHHARPRRLHGQ